MSKFFYNRATKRICAKKPFIVIEFKFSQRTKTYTNVPIGQKNWLVKNTTHFILCVNEMLKVYGVNGENQSEMNS